MFSLFNYVVYFVLIQSLPHSLSPPFSFSFPKKKEGKKKTQRKPQKETERDY